MLLNTFLIIIGCVFVCIGTYIFIHGVKLINSTKIEDKPIPKDFVQFNFPKPNGWVCYLYGYGTQRHTSYSLMDDQKAPCWFHRKMQELCFGIKWRYNA